MKAKIIPFKIINGEMHYNVKYKLKGHLFWRVCNVRCYDDVDLPYTDTAAMPLEDAKNLVKELEGIEK